MNPVAKEMKPALKMQFSTVYNHSAALAVKEINVKSKLSFEITGYFLDDNDARSFLLITDKIIDSSRYLMSKPVETIEVARN